MKAKSKAATKQAAKKKVSPPKKPKGKAVKALSTLVLKGGSVHKTLKGKGTIKDDGIWIYDDNDPSGSPIWLPVETAPPTDYYTISCYDPMAPNEPPVVDAFVFYDPLVSPDPVIQYDSSQDYLMIDMSALDSFEENYDPTTPEPYQCSDSSGSIGIDG